ncbi:MAG: hypothetical protein AAB538_00730 [Patescibacteria group bacterium]
MWVSIAYAANENPVVSKVIGTIGSVIINPLIQLLFAVAVAYFLYGVFQFIRKSQEGKPEEGAQHILWGIIGFVIMLSVYAIINFILNTFGINKPPGL